MIGEQEIITKDISRASARAIARKNRIKKAPYNHEISNEQNSQSENCDLEDDHVVETDSNNDSSDDNYDSDDHVCSGDCCSGDSSNTPD